MIKALYSLFGRAAYHISEPVVILIGRNARPRVRVIIIDGTGRILLVRNWFGNQQWTLPGGGVKRQEPPAHAAARELCEELSIDLSADSLRPVGTVERGSSIPFTATIFDVDLPSGAIISRNSLELIDHKWTLPNSLPTGVHPLAVQAVNLWRG